VTPDTGSADLWVYGPNAPTTHSRFNIGTSSTIATDGTADWRISYGSGSLRGFLARDTVSLAGLRVPQQIFALANTTVPIFETLRAFPFLNISCGALSNFIKTSDMISYRRSTRYGFHEHSLVSFSNFLLELDVFQRRRPTLLLLRRAKPG
jgi:hypothetical protein